VLVLGLLGPHKEEEEALYSEVVVRLRSRRESSFTQSSSKTPKLLMTPNTQRREREREKEKEKERENIYMFKDSKKSS